jgi:hypothetical protein
VLGVEALVWDTSLLSASHAFALAADAIVGLLRAQRPLLALYVTGRLQAAIAALQRAIPVLPVADVAQRAVPDAPVLRALWTRVAAEAAACGDAAVAQVAGALAAGGAMPRPAEVPPALLTAQDLWLRGRTSEAIVAFRTAGPVGAAPLAAALLLVHDVAGAVAVAQAQLTPDGGSVAHSATAVGIVVSALTAYLAGESAEVPLPTCAESAAPRLRRVERTALVAAAAAAPVAWSVRTAVSLHLALGAVASAAAVLARADDRLGAVRLVLSCDRLRYVLARFHCRAHRD